MKKFFMFFAAVMMLSMTAVSFSSCSKDGDETSNFDSVKKQIIGTWKGRVVTGSMTINGETKYFYDDVVITITNSTCHIVATDYDKTFSYTINQNGDYYIDLGEFPLFFRVNGTTLKITGTNGTAGMWLLGDYTKQ